MGVFEVEEYNASVKIYYQFHWNHNVTLNVKKNGHHRNQWLNKNCSADHHFNRSILTRSTARHKKTIITKNTNHSLDT